jgi:hypothetical protein
MSDDSPRVRVVEALSEEQLAALREIDPGLGAERRREEVAD